MASHASHFLRVVVPLFLLAAPSIVRSQDNGIFLGATLADVSGDYGWRNSLLAASADEDTSGFKLIGGVRPLDHFAIEADYADFGTTKADLSIVCIAMVGYPCPNRASIDTSAVSVSMLGFVTLPLIDIYGRVGVARWQADGDVRFTSAGNGLSVPTTREGTDPVLGVGVQFRFASMALRAEYEHFKILDDSADVISVGLTYTFL
jgi:Outer membrane protein beta-barrel domain